MKPFLHIICWISVFTILHSCSGKTSSESTQSSQNESISLSDSKENSTESLVTTVDKGAKDVPIHSTESEFKGFKVLGNLRYHFEIDIPSNWQAKESSDDGDGFAVLIPGLESVEIKVYGEEYEPEFASFYTESCDELIDFTFNNSVVGKRCSNETEMTYWMIVSQDKLNVYIKGWDALDIAQKTNLTTMVKTLRKGTTAAPNA